MFRVFLILAFVAAWFLPLIIAALYKLPHQRPIAVLSLLLGWTGAGWLAALVIAVGGAIRATRPAVAATEPSATLPSATERSSGSAAAQAYAPAQSPWPANAATVPPSPGGAQHPGQARSPGQAHSPGQAPYPERAQALERAPAPAPPSWPDDPH